VSKSTPPFAIEVLVGGAWQPATESGMPLVYQSAPGARRELARRYPVSYERIRQGGEATVRIVDRYGYEQRIPRAP
jgi:hypothetical protein